MRPSPLITAIAGLLLAIGVSVLALFLVARPCPPGATNAVPPPLKPGTVLTDTEFQARYAGNEEALAACNKWIAETSPTQRLRMDAGWYFGFVGPTFLLAFGIVRRQSTWGELVPYGVGALGTMLLLGPHTYGLLFLAAAAALLLLLKRRKGAGVAA